MFSLDCYSIQGQGQKTNQEDAIYISPQDDNLQLFMVCDGVGGAAKGEVASNIVIKSIQDYVKKNIQNYNNDAFIQAAVSASELSLNNYLNKNESAIGMGTTLALLCFNDKGAVAAHIGDSRIYHIRNKEIIWQSTDHSLVSEMVASGIITEAQAIDHPKNNVITRALQGNLEKKIRPDIHIFEKIESHDHFFICSDGVLEAFNDEQLVNGLSEKVKLKPKLEAIANICLKKSRDNYSAISIEIKDMDQSEISKRKNIVKKVIKSVLNIFSSKAENS